MGTNRKVPGAGSGHQGMAEPAGRRILGRAVLLFLPQAALGGLVLYLLFDLQAAGVRSVVEANQEKAVAIAAQRAAAGLADVYADLRYLAARNDMLEVLAAPEDGVPSDLAADLRMFALQKALYDQIRVIDATGQERLRIDWNAGRPILQPADRLQNKAGRYYFREIMSRAPGKVYVSPFDLNVEHGSLEEEPRPVIRFGTPVQDSAGQRIGAVVLNLLGRPLLDDIAALSAPGPDQTWLLNAAGYWLLGPTRQVEWAFMYPGRDAESFANAYPEAWQWMQAGPPSGQMRTARGLFSYARMSPGDDRAGIATADSRGPTWTLVSFLPADFLAAQRLDQAKDFLPAAVALALLLAGLSFAIARNGVRRQQAEARLRAGEERFRALLESAPDGVVIIDPEGRIVLVNAETERLFGHARDRLIGADVEMLVPAAERGRHVGHRRDYLSEPRVREMGAGLDLHGLRADGSTFPVAISLSPVTTDEGLLILADIRDISERQQAERQIQALNLRLTRDNAELAALNRELEAFSYSVSHDLRAPLRAIDGFSLALLEDCAEQLDQDGRQYLHRVRQAAQRMGQLIDDLLTLSRVSRQELSVQEVDLGAMARAILEGLKAEAPGRDAEFQIADGLLASGDARLLQIALENLLGNAWKFTGGRSTARIEFGCGMVGGEAAFHVRDNGAGFDMAYADQLFRAFQRLHAGSEFPGTGIGLATVQRIINKHGGRVWAEAVPDRGATFYFSL